MQRKSACYRRVLVVTEPVVSGTQYALITHFVV